MDVKLVSHRYYLGDQIKKKVMGRPYGTHGGEKRFIQSFGWET
jgi:hypothetical protein